MVTQNTGLLSKLKEGTPVEIQVKYINDDERQKFEFRGLTKLNNEYVLFR